MTASSPGVPATAEPAHRIETDYDAGYWECSCGAAGSVGSAGDVDLASDRHIRSGEGRVDVRRTR